jgi:hypothetical protein
MPLYSIDPLHPDRLRCNLCGATVAALPDDGEAPPGALSADQAAHLWPGLASNTMFCVAGTRGRCTSASTRPRDQGGRGDVP